MNIAFDGSIFALGYRDRGLGRFAFHLIKNLLNQIDYKDTIYIITYNGYEIEKKFYDKRVKLLDIYLGPCNEKRNMNKNQWLFTYPSIENIGSEIIERSLIINDIDIYYLFNHDVNPFNFIKYIKERGKSKVKFIVGLADLIPLVFKNYYLNEEKIYNTYIDSLEIFKYADAVISISDSAKNDLVKFCNIDANIIHTIYLGSTFEDKNNNIKLTIDEVKRKYRIKKPYLLYTGGDEYRKNMASLIKSFAKANKAIHKDYQLVIVCSLWQKDYYENIIKQCNLIDNVILTDYISDEELHLLYQNANAFIFPSLYEGFGLPILEAMYYNLPVAISNTSSMPEITGENGLMFDPNNERDISEAINKILLDEECRKEQIELSKERRQLFSWDKCAKETLDLFKKLTGENEYDIVRGQRPKVAMLTPMPPEKTGIADYSLERLPYWSKYFDIDIFTSNPNKSRKWLSKEYNIYQYSDFEAMVYNYDYIFYQVGNSTFHLDILKYVEKYPGIVILHDYNLKDLFRCLYFDKSINEDALYKILSIQYEQNIDILKKEFISNDIEINRIATTNALGVIVHSEYAKNNLLKFNNLLPISVVTLGSLNYDIDIDSVTKDDLLKKYNIKNDDIVFGSFGIIHTNKRHYELMETFAKYIDNKDDKSKYKLLLVGEIDEIDKFNQHYRKLKEKYDIEDNIIVTGYTDMDTFSNLMYICNAVFNLRYPSIGETSGSLARLMMIGKPVVVTNIATYSELPDDTCIKIGYGDTEEDEILSVFNEWETNRDRLLKIGKNARQYMLDKCTLTDNAIGYNDIIYKLFQLSLNSNMNISKELLNKIIEVYNENFNDEDYSKLNKELLKITDILFRIQF